MKRQTGKMLIQDMGLKVGEKFMSGSHIMVYGGVRKHHDKVWDLIVPLAVWNKEHKN